MGKLRFAKVSSFYPDMLEKLYATDTELSQQSYHAQFRRMMDQGIGWADYWIVNLNKTKTIQAELFIINNESAQKTWALEHQYVFDNDKWQIDILIEQIRHFKPNILFANDYVYLKPEHIIQLKREVPSIRKVVGWDGIGLCDPQRFSACDAMISCGQQFVDFYKSNGFPAYLFQFGFESTLLDKLDMSDKKYSISFAGSLTLRKGGHHERLKLLGAVARKFPVDYWLSSFDNNKPYLIKNIFQKFSRGAFSDVGDILRLWMKNKGNVFGLEMYQVLASSHITLNSHIDTAVQVAGNIRLWEATGLGACLVTDWKENMHELFREDEEVVVYKSKEECVEKISWLLNNPEKMHAIAKAGQKRTLEQYSYEKRIAEFVPVILGMI